MKMNEKGNNREEQIFAAAQEKFKTLSPLVRITACATFTLGAIWADEHPKRNNKDENDWTDNLFRGLSNPHSALSPMERMSRDAIILLGAIWADENPPRDIEDIVPIP